MPLYSRPQLDISPSSRRSLEDRENQMDFNFQPGSVSLSVSSDTRTGRMLSDSTLLLGEKELSASSRGNWGFILVFSRTAVCRTSWGMVTGILRGRQAPWAVELLKAGLLQWWEVCTVFRLLSDFQWSHVGCWSCSYWKLGRKREKSYVKLYPDALIIFHMCSICHSLNAKFRQNLHWLFHL